MVLTTGVRKKLPKKDRLRVADFFCGAGGFSEGFRQKGFDIVFALDNWKPAIETHRFNQGDRCVRVQRDILSIRPEEIDDLVPDTEIMIGSPSCVAFSGSNRAGKADKSMGIRLIKKYLQIVAHKKNKEGSRLRYWVLENVPNAMKHIKMSYTFKELGLPGGDRVALQATRCDVYNAADFGAPQTRRRAFLGDYPSPVKTGSEVKTLSLGDVVSNLSAKGPRIKDPNYGFEIPAKELTDWRYETRVERFEWERARRLKVDHSYMGRMSFPEDEARPARTVMATMSSSTRESMILGVRKRGRVVGYRRPTIREVASLMSFPVTYQFIGDSEATKYRLVGNAVCVKMAGAIAQSIRKAEGLPLVDIPNPHVGFRLPPFDLNGQTRRKKLPRPRRLDARFRMHVPGIKVRSFRVDLDNLASEFDSERFVWRSTLHLGTGKDARVSSVDFSEIQKALVNHRAFPKFKEAVRRELIESAPNAMTFQLAFCRLVNHGTLGPEMALKKVRRLVDNYYPSTSEEIVPLPRRSAKMIGRDAIPVRIAAALYAISALEESIMRAA